VINLGVMKTNGYCNIPEITVANHPDLQKYSSGSTTVDLVLQDDCSLKVAGIDTSGASPMSSPDTLGVHIKGWAKAELNDFAGIDLAATYTEMQWYDYGSYVDEGSDLVDWCHWFSTSGWRNDSCDAYWWPYGSDYVYSQTIGAFHNVNCLGDGCARTLESQVHAEPAYQITLSCSQSPNQSPPGTHFLCNSDWTTVN